MEKLDLKTQYKGLYTASAKSVTVVNVPGLQFATIAGEIPPHEKPGTSPQFAEDVSALYSAVYTLKFMIKKRDENPIDYPVMPLEGLWSAASGRYDPTQPDTWLYRMLIMVPDMISAELLAEAVDKAQKKKPNPTLARVGLLPFHEGPTIQTLHLGPYATEPETLARMETFTQGAGYIWHGLHHEIYLSDPFRSAPEKLRTILRHPIRS